VFQLEVVYFFFFSSFLAFFEDMHISYFSSEQMFSLHV